MHYQNEMEQLKEVQRVEVPAHLRAHIDARIAQAAQESVPTGWVWGFAATVAFLIALNGLALLRAQQDGTENANAAQVISEGMGISQSNQLYYE